MFYLSYSYLFFSSFFFFNDTATTEIYTLSLHDALPILPHPAPPTLRTRTAPCRRDVRISRRRARLYHRVVREANPSSAEFCREPPAAAGRPSRIRTDRARGCAMARRTSAGLLALLVMVLLAAQPAWACGGLVGDGGTVQLARTTTLAGYHDGVEHYLTSFTYSGGGARFGAITPLPGVPSDVRKGGEWSLQRLVLETQPQLQALDGAEFAAAARASAPAEVLLKTRVDALDVTILRGGGKAVGDWARKHGFGLSVDAPEVLDFYAARSPIFMATSFDARAASARGQQL